MRLVHRIIAWLMNDDRGNALKKQPETPSYSAKCLLATIWNAPVEWSVEKALGNALRLYGEDAFDECDRWLNKPEDRQGGE